MQPQSRADSATVTLRFTHGGCNFNQIGKDKKLVNNYKNIENF